MNERIVYTRNPGKKAQALISQNEGGLPVWIRPPARGREHYTGLTRPKLYSLAKAGVIRSVSVTEPGRVRGCRLFHLPSILDYLDQCSEVKDNLESLGKVIEAALRDLDQGRDVKGRVEPREA